MSSFLFSSIKSSYMISRESVNRSVIHRYSLYFQTENKIVAPDTRQLIKNSQPVPFLTTNYFFKKPHHTCLTGS